MKDILCVLYDGADSLYAKEAKQVKIVFRPESENLEKYIETNQEKQIYMLLKPEYFTLENMKRIESLKKFENWTLILPVELILDAKKKLDMVKFNAIKDCCNKYMFTDMIGNWEVLQFILSLEPSEVYLTNMLGFCIPDAKKVCGSTGIRLVANMAQTAWDSSPDLTKFFIRPEDVDVYTPYISGIEFVGDAPIQEVCYKVYNRGYWYGDLCELIIGFDDHVDSRTLPPQFGEYRLKCKKRCITGSKCTLCNSMKVFSEKLKEANLRIIPKK